jgi:hypothetical protein
LHANYERFGDLTGVEFIFDRLIQTTFGANGDKPAAMSSS